MQTRDILSKDVKHLSPKSILCFVDFQKNMDSFLNMFGNEVKHSYSVARARIDKRLGKMSSLHHNLRICNIISF